MKTKTHNTLMRAGIITALGAVVIDMIIKNPVEITWCSQFGGVEVIALLVAGLCWLNIKKS